MAFLCPGLKAGVMPFSFLLAIRNADQGNSAGSWIRPSQVEGISNIRAKALLLITPGLTACRHSFRRLCHSFSAGTRWSKAGGIGVLQ